VSDIGVVRTEGFDMSSGLSSPESLAHGRRGERRGRVEEEERRRRWEEEAEALVRGKR
jgi:hypothetical protein